MVPGDWDFGKDCFESSARLARQLGVSCRIQSLAPWAFVAFRSCFSVGIGEKAPQPNQPMKRTAPWRGNSSELATNSASGLSFCR